MTSLRRSALALTLTVGVGAAGVACRRECPPEAPAPPPAHVAATGGAATAGAAPDVAATGSAATAGEAPHVAATGSAAAAGAAPHVAATGGAATAGAAPDAPAPAPPPGASSGVAVVVAPAVASVEAPPLLDAAGQPLPQTEARPTADSAWLLRGAALLLDAIVHDDPERARPFFFPVSSYTLVKAIERPAADWKARLWRLFARDVHALHRRHAGSLDGATLVGVSVPEARVRWMKPGAEGNKLGYHRVLRARLTFRTATGEERSVELTSLISWRGEWYLVHLSGFS